MFRFSLACFLLTALLTACNSAPPTSTTQPLTATRPATATTRPTTRPAASMVYYLVEGLLVRTDIQAKARKELTRPDQMKILSFHLTPDGSKLACLLQLPNSPGAKDGVWASPPVVALLDGDGNLLTAVKNSGAAKGYANFGPPTLLRGGIRVGFVATVPDAGGGLPSISPMASIISVGIDGGDSQRIATVCINPPERLGKDYGTSINATAGDNFECDHADWSPDGKTILCTLARMVKVPGTAQSRIEHRLWAMNADGTNLRQIGPDGSAFATYSPKGQRIVYLQESDTTSEIMVASADGSHPHQVTHLAAKLSAPYWLTDGTTIVFLKTETPGTTSVWAIQSDGTRLHQIFTGNLPNLFR